MTTSIVSATQPSRFRVWVLFISLWALSWSALALTNTWSSTGGLIDGRRSHSATLLPSGKVLVSGGLGVASNSYLASTELYDPDNGRWAQASPLTTGRARHTATFLPSGKVLVIGGSGPTGQLASAELYDPATNAWTAAGNLATAREQHSATLLTSGKVLVSGGYGASGHLASAELYDPTSNTWSTAGVLTNARYVHTATLLPSGKVLVVGGNNGSALASAELYDPATNSWSAARNLASARDSHSATLLPSGRVLVSGGYGASGALANAEQYDPVTNTWTAAGNGVTARYNHGATLLPSGKLMISGGISNAGFIASAELYDPATNSWTATASLSAARSNFCATLLASGQVLVSGGYNGASLNTAELYDPAANSWAVAGNLASGRYNHTATLLPSGKVLVSGGLNGLSANLTSTELYDPVTNSWSAGGNLATGRNLQSATLLPSGKVLVVGGNSASGILASAELYDPVSNTWSAAGNLATGRYVHTATLLPSGKVLVSGGISNSGALSSAELYDATSNTWSTAANLVTGRGYHTATLLASGKVLVSGGNNAIGYLTSAELYEPSTNLWSAAGSLTTPRSGHQATLLPSGKVLASSGYYVTSGFLTSAEIYDPATNSWSGAGNLSTGRINHTATVLPTGKVLVSAGFNAKDGFLASAELYTPATNTWSTASALATIRSAPSATLLSSGKILVSGGQSVANSAAASAELYTHDIGIADSRRPVISSINSPVLLGTALQLTGTQFTGDSEASSGANGNSASNYPLLQLMRVDNDQVSWLSAASASSATSFTSKVLSGLPASPYRATLFVDGIASVSKIIRLVSSWTVNPSSSGNGSISPGVPQSVSDGRQLTFNLSPNAGYSIASVTGTCGGNLTGNTFITNAVSTDCTVVANFVVPTFTITATASPTAGGSVACTPNPVNTGGSSTCTATANAGYTFSAFSGDCTGATCTLSNVQSNKTVTATFTQNSYTISGTASPVAGGSVTCAPASVIYGGNSTCTATANAGYTFSAFSGDCTGAACTLSNVQSNKSVTATFTQNTYTVTTTASPAAGGRVSCTPNPVTSGGNSTCTATANTGYTFSAFSGDCAGTTCTLANVQSNKSVTATFTAASVSRLVNLSTRGQVQTDNNVMIGGFVVGGSTPKTVLIRAVGPNLANFGVTGVLANPVLQVFSGPNVIASNDDWGTAANVAAIQATGLAPASPLESAVLMSLNPGAYTALVSGSGGGTGVGIVEVYEIDNPASTFTNISTRGQVLTGNDVMIGGFVIQGSANQTVLIRAVGPNLANFGVTGVLANPTLQLFSGPTMIASNDDWGSASNAAAIQATGLAPANSLESAILISLPPGAYTAIVSGSGGGTGVGIVEVFAQ